MICHDIREQLSSYLDGELETNALARVRTHLGGCGDCAERRDALAHVDHLVAASLSDHPFGDAAVETILSGLDLTRLRPAAPAPVRVETRFPRWAMGGLSIAAAALLVSLSLSLLQREHTSQETLAARAPIAVEVGEAGTGLMRLDGDQSMVARGTRLETRQKLLAVGNPASIYLDDGTVLELHADTEVELKRDADGGLTVHMLGHEGKVYCEVSKQEAPFRVKARGLDVQVLGTRFVVEQASRSASVTVIEGRVRASSPADALILTAEDKAEMLVGQSRLIRSKVTPRRAALWVPRVRSEQGDLDRSRVRKTEQVRTPQRPVDRKPAKPTAPPEDLDQPVLPPKKDDK